MKGIFPGYFKKSDDEISEMWVNGIICFDANVLLNLYRYSDETRNELIGLIEKLSKQICLPHQAALEFNRNRYEVIAEQEKTYKEFISKLNQIEEDLKSTSKPPFLSKKNHNALQKVFESVKNEVEQSIEKYIRYFKQDEIFNKISKLFEGKISDPFEVKEIELILKEGTERYEKKIPPGYEDAKAKKDDKKFGDLILWKQLIKIAKEKSQPIILITDERKEDWWWKINDGRIMGPRYELVQEMKVISQVDFHMYSSERFLSFGLKYLNVHVNKKAIEELKEIAKTERLYFRQEKARLGRRLIEEKFLEKKAFEKFVQLEYEIKKVEQRINSVKHGLEVYKHDPNNKSETKERIIDLSIDLQNMKNKLEMLIGERNYLLEKYGDSQ